MNEEKYVVIHGQYLVDVEEETVHKVIVQGDGHEMETNDLLAGGTVAILDTQEIDTVSILIESPNDEKAEEILKEAKKVWKREKEGIW